MDLATLRSTASSIEDPVERTRFLLRVIDEQQGFITEAARLRRLAIIEAREAGLTQEEIARALGLTAGRVSQMTKGVNYVVTGWFAPEVAIEPTVSIIGSRSSTTDNEVVTATVRALGELLTRRRLRVTHGPAGVGIEALTHVADHYRPPELGSVTGVFGHPNVIKGSEYVLVIGGGQGTEEEVRIAVSMNKKIIPMQTSGGAAATAYALLQETPARRAWMSEDHCAALATAGPEEYARLVDELLPVEQGHGGQAS